MTDEPSIASATSSAPLSRGCGAKPSVVTHGKLTQRQAANRAGLRAYNDYIAEWHKTQRPCGEDVEAEVQAESDRLEAEYTKHHLAELIQSGGVAGGAALPPATTSEISPT